MINLLHRSAMTTRSRRRRRSAARRAVAAVEAAVALPLLILLVFGSIELANGIFLTQALSAAAYEGAREATRPGGTASAAQQRMTEVLVSRGVTNFIVTINPAISEATLRGTQITATAAAPMSALAGNTIGILGNRQATQSVHMVRQ